MRNRETGHTLAELIIVVLFIGIFAAIAVPRINFGIITKQKAETVAKKIVTDLRRTRSLAISDAASNTDGYELNMLGSEPYTGYEIRNSDTDAVIDTHTIPSDLKCTGGSKFEFGPMGNLTGGDTSLTVDGGRSFTITLIQATGTVKCVQN